MAAARYIVQPVPNGQFRVWDTKTQGVAYLPRTLSETTPSRVEAKDYACRLNDCASALAALRGARPPLKQNVMPFEIRPLRTLAAEITRKAFRGANDGSLDAGEVDELNRCANALTRIAALATTYRLGDVLRCDSLDDLVLLRDKYAKQYPDLAEAIDRVTDRPIY